MAGTAHAPRTRPPLLAGAFYPADAPALRRLAQRLLDDAEPVALDHPLRAVIAPHAGYRYSGPVAATVYAAVRASDRQLQPIRRVVLLGPSHRVPFPGLATPTTDAFATPLGAVPLDHEALATLDRLPQVARLDEAHAPEHCLEAHLPLLQLALGEFTLVPLTCGDTTAADAAEVLLTLADDRTLLAVSSDLSHYHPHAAAQARDRATAAAIAAGRGADVGPDDACGYLAVRGLLLAAQRRGWTTRCVDLRDSSETGGGDPNHVVGYGGFLCS